MDKNAGRKGVVWIGLAAVMALAGCEALRPTELTFAGRGEMVRGVRSITTDVEYFDETAKEVRVKKARIDPPFWIVPEEAVEGR